MNSLYPSLSLPASARRHATIPVLWALLGTLLVLSSVMTFSTEVNHELNGFRSADQFYQDGATVRAVVAFSKLLLLVNPLLVTVFALGLSRLMYKNRQPQFTEVLSIVLRGEIVYAVGLILAAPLILATNNVNVSFSLAPLVVQLGYSTSSDLFFLLSRANLFFILEVVVVGPGLSRLCCCSPKDGILIALLSVGSFSILLMLMRVLYLSCKSHKYVECNQAVL